MLTQAKVVFMECDDDRFAGLANDNDGAFTLDDLYLEAVDLRDRPQFDLAAPGRLLCRHFFTIRLKLVV